MRKYWGPNSARATVVHLGLCADERDRDALHHGVDEAREGVMREGEATGLVANGVVNEALEVLAKGTECLNGQ